MVPVDVSPVASSAEHDRGLRGRCDGARTPAGVGCGGLALMALTVDDHVSENILEGVKNTTGADLARTVDLEK